MFVHVVGRGGGEKGEKWGGVHISPNYRKEAILPLEMKVI
jgi:hypothetical protein